MCRFEPYPLQWMILTLRATPAAADDYWMLPFLPSITSTMPQLSWPMTLEERTTWKLSRLPSREKTLAIVTTLDFYRARSDAVPRGVNSLRHQGPVVDILVLVFPFAISEWC